MTDDGFTTVAGKRSKHKPKEIDQDYFNWVKNGNWEESFKKYSDRSMSKFEQKCPKEKYETDEDYQDRCDKVYQNLKRKWGSCNLPIEDCFAQSEYSDEHYKCEENRQNAYKIYLSRVPPDEKPKALAPQFNTIVDFPTLGNDKPMMDGRRQMFCEFGKNVKKNYCDPNSDAKPIERRTLMKDLKNQNYSDNDPNSDANCIVKKKSTQEDEQKPKFKVKKIDVFYEEEPKKQQRPPKMEKKKKVEEEELDLLCQSIEALGDNNKKKKASSKEKK